MTRPPLRPVRVPADPEERARRLDRLLELDAIARRRPDAIRWEPWHAWASRQWAALTGEGEQSCIR